MNLDSFFEKFELFAEAPNAVGKMRELILDLAGRGRLVPQDLHDDQVELSFPRLAIYSEQIDNDIFPANWLRVPLGKLGEWRGGGTPSKARSDYWEGSIPWVSPKDMKTLWISDSQDHISQTAVEESSVRMIPTGSLLMVVRGMILAHSFPVALTKRDVTINQDMKALLPSEPATAHFLLTALRSFKTDILNSVERSTHGTCKLQTEILENFIIGIPPLAEQKRIVAKVDELMALCDRLEAQQKERETRHTALVQASLTRFADAPTPANLELLFHKSYSIEPAELRKSILTLAVQGKLAAQSINDVENGHDLCARIERVRESLIARGTIKRTHLAAAVEPEFSIPETWCWTTLGAAFDVRDGTHDTPRYVSDGYPLVTSKNLSSGKLSLEQVQLISATDHKKICERSRVERNDILFAMIGSIGNPVIVDTDTEFSIKNVALFKYFDQSLAEPMFLLFYLKFASEVMREQAAGGVQAFVSLGALRRYPFPLPPLPEQKRIVAKVEELMGLVDRLEALLSESRERAAGLMDAVVAEIARAA